MRRMLFLYLMLTAGASFGGAMAYDVIVCGGGPSGCAAALSARRAGLRVLLVEAQGQLGGTATSGGVAHWLGGRNDAGEWVVGGIFKELSLRAEKEGAALLPEMPKGKTYQPYAWLPWFIHGVVLDPNRIALMLDRVMAEAGVDVLFETVATGVERSGARITSVTVHNKGGFTTIDAKAVIDATGDADVAAAAGVPLLVGRDGDHLTAPASLTFHLSHVDHARLWAEIERTHEPKFRPLIAELKKKGEWPFPYDIFITVKGLSDDELMVNTMRLVDVNGLDGFSRSKAYARGREEAFKLLDVFRRHFPGFENATMKSVAPMLGVRETRRLDGNFALTVEDLRKGTEFPDTIGYSMYGWDLPDPKRPSVQPLVDESDGKFVNRARKQLVTPIPFRIMVPKGVSNLLVTGRAVSVERDVLGPLRVMAPCMAMGEAAGLAATWLVRGEMVDVAALRKELVLYGCLVDKVALPVVRPRHDPSSLIPHPSSLNCSGLPSDGRTVEVPAASAFTASVWAEVSEPGGPKNVCPRFFQLPYGYLHAYQSLSNPDTVDLVLGFNVPKSERVKNGVSSWTVEAVVPMRRWAHVALVARAGDEGLPELYVNGKRVGERMRPKPMPAAFPAGKATIGNTAVGGSRPFFGRLADFSFVPRAMTADEIAAAAQRDPDGKAPRLLVQSSRDDLPIVDLAHDVVRQTVVASGGKIYQGHPTTVVAPDGSLFCVWTTEHGGPCGPMARSADGGRTWTRCDDIMPDAYKTYSNCPTLQKIVRQDGGVNLAVFSNCRGKCGIVISEDGGKHWKAAPLADVSSGMPPTGFMMLKDGTAAIFGQVHKKGKTGDRPNSDQDIWMSVSKDGGWTWGPMRTVASAPEKNLCEPCCLRSPDGKELCLLMRENRHGGNSMMCFSRDEGRTWTKPEETCWGLSGDRHEAAYLPDGRLIVAFRDRAIGSSTYGHYVGWIGSYADVRAGVRGKGGDLRVWLTDSRGEAVWDTGYSGVEVLADGTVVCTTYVRYRAEDEGNSVVSTRFTLNDLRSGKSR